MVRQRETKRDHGANRDTPWNEQTARQRLDQLAQEQGVGDRTPDYGVLATEIWPTQRDIENWDAWLSEIRRKGVSADIDA